MGTRTGRRSLNATSVAATTFVASAHRASFTLSANVVAFTVLAAVAVFTVVGPGALIATPVAHAQVVVFPLDARGVDPGQAESATQAVLSALQGIERLRVMDPKTVEKRLDVNLIEQARACQYDVFCLVEIGEILETATVLLGHVQSNPEAESPPYELKLVVLDVDRATIAEVLIWRFGELERLPAAADAAGRRLFGPQDAEVELRVEPTGAKISLYGDPQTLPLAGPWATWSGTYQLKVEADGYLPATRTWSPPAGKSQLDVALEPDPLYVRRSPTEVQPFDQPSRRLGSGVTARELRITPQEDEPPSAYGRPWPWVTTGVGVAAVIAGAVLMVTAQADYNALANEVRFSPSMTTRSDLARPERDAANLRHQIGGGVVAGGALIAVSGLIWLWAGGDDAPVADRRTPDATAPLTSAQRRAAAALAETYTERGP